MENGLLNKLLLAPTSLPNARPLELIEAATKARYDGFGIRLFRSPGKTYPFHPVSPAEAPDVLAAARDSGLEVWDILSFYLQPEMDLDSMLPAFELGGRLGARYALVVGDDPDWPRMVASFQRMAAALA